MVNFGNLAFRSGNNHFSRVQSCSTHLESDGWVTCKCQVNWQGAGYLRLERQVKGPRRYRGNKHRGDPNLDLNIYQMGTSTEAGQIDNRPNRSIPGYQTIPH